MYPIEYHTVDNRYGVHVNMSIEKPSLLALFEAKGMVLRLLDDVEARIKYEHEMAKTVEGL